MRDVDHFSMADPATASCPFAYYDAMRREAPVHRDPGTGFWWVTTHDLNIQCLMDTERFSSKGDLLIKKHFRPRAQALWDAAGMKAIDTLVTTDPPEHDDYRSVGIKLFSYRTVEEMVPRIEKLVHELIDNFAAKGEVDFLREFARPLPATIVCDEFGFPREDQPCFKAWTDALFGMMTPGISEDTEVELIQKVIEMFRYLDNHIKQAAQGPAGRVIHSLATLNRKDGTPFTALERSWMAITTFAGGNDTTRNMLASCMHKLVLCPELQDELRGNNDRIEAFVEEMLRLESSVQGLPRVATCDIEIAGVTIPNGSNIVLCPPAANRDPVRWPQADEFHLDRPDGNRHIAFGHGRHACFGIQLARRELQIAMRIFLDRLRDIRLANPDEPVRHLPVPFFREIANLSIRFTPEAA